MGPSEAWSATSGQHQQYFQPSPSSVAQRLPTDLEKKIESFLCYVKQKRKVEFENQFNINMEETPMYFSLLPGKTVDVKGRTSIRIHTEVRNATWQLFMLSLPTWHPTDHGTFKGKPQRVQSQEKAWMDETLMHICVTEILLPHSKKEHCLLTMDSFHAHLMDDVKQTFWKGNTVTAILERQHCDSLAIVCPRYNLSICLWTSCSRSTSERVGHRSFGQLQKRGEKRQKQQKDWRLLTRLQFCHGSLKPCLHSRSRKRLSWNHLKSVESLTTWMVWRILWYDVTLCNAQTHQPRICPLLAMTRMMKNLKVFQLVI